LKISRSRDAIVLILRLFRMKVLAHYLIEISGIKCSFVCLQQRHSAIP
jgi:hypothetical protein